MKIETIDKANQLIKQINTLKRFQRDATVGTLFLSTIRKSYPRQALQETADILKQNLQLGIEKLEKQLEEL